ncbi:MAG: protein phosphatase 2C domain-containing protein, partial [Synechococcus sp. ELA057]
MSDALHGWLPPRCDSRTGAAHQRRGAPCQDASGIWTFLDGAGQPVQALVVSDGHGGAKYDRSDLGSQIACRVALAEVQQRLSRARLNQGDNDEAWRQWLLETLPEQIVERWCQDVLNHGRAHPRDDGAPPSTLAYGATLGLLLLTPRWWGYSGLGDWDLVRINADGSAELISEEPDNPGGGEATFSLCMEGAARHFAPRSGLVPINAGQAPFSLLLSSDGIRKSCGTDADYLTLAHYLCELSNSPGDLETSELGQALDHISTQGSGDDVSVAIGRWGQLQDHRRGT